MKRPRNQSLNKKKWLLRLMPVLLLVLACSCSNIKYLPEGEKLYVGAEVKLEGDSALKSKKERKALKNELEDLLRPEPNKSILGLRPGLWFYNIAGKPRGKGLRYILRNKLGEAPVLYSQVNPEKNREILRNRLENKGYFISDAYYRPDEKNRKVHLTYTAKLSRPYTIEKVTYPEGNTGIVGNIKRFTSSSLLKPGDVYSLETLKAERSRMADSLKDIGYYYFNADFLVFKVDSTLGDRKLQVNMRIKENTPPKALVPYKLNNVSIYPRVGRNRVRDSVRRLNDSVLIDGYRYIGPKRIFKPKVIIRSVYLKPGKLYSRNDYQLTLYRLMNLGTFKFVNIRLDDVDTTAGDTGLLNAAVMLTPMPRRTLRADLRLVSKSNDFAGPRLTTTFRNRNLFHGAEQLDINLNASFETLISGQTRGVFSYVLGADAELQVPRFLAPFRIHEPTNRFVPRTVFNFGADRLSRVQYYTLNSLNMSAGYRWNETERKQHELFPIMVNYLQLENTTERFRDIVRDNIAIQRSFATQFILGNMYTFTYNTNADVTRKHNFLFKGSFDASGNVAYLLNKAFNKEKFQIDTPYRFLGAPFSQFSRIVLDFRHYLTLDKHSQLASRAFAGVGVPYGNSFTLPYTKQFFGGGNTSIRAFQARSLGPGTYRSKDGNRSGFFIDQAGDIRLEVNTEYRFDIYKILKGALFVDAGNIWLSRNDTARPGGVFKPATFLNETAIGTGFGLRVDVSFFVVRFDLGVPLRKPYLPEGERWVADNIAFGKSAWRRDNLVLNIAIGYPF